MTGEYLAERIAKDGRHHATYVASFADAAELATKSAQPGDLVLTLGAGNVSQLGPMVLEHLEASIGAHN